MLTIILIGTPTRRRSAGRRDALPAPPPCWPLPRWWQLLNSVLTDESLMTHFIVPLSSQNTLHLSFWDYITSWFRCADRQRDGSPGPASRELSRAATATSASRNMSRTITEIFLFLRANKSGYSVQYILFLIIHLLCGPGDINGCLVTKCHAAFPR